MRKLTVDEIIQCLVDAYERLLKLEGNTALEQWQWVDDKQNITTVSLNALKEYYEAKGEVKALRWVLGQDELSHLESNHDKWFNDKNSGDKMP